MDKVAVLAYHKNLKSIYPDDWISRYYSSIKAQTFQGFEIYEFNYGGDNERIFENSFFESFPYPTFVHALNYLLDKVFSGGYDVVFNTNVDDHYREDWMELLLADVKRGYDLVSCNFCLFRDRSIFKYHQFHKLDILKELEKGHNPVAHPAVAYTKKFWEENRYDPNEIPFEDLELWKRALKSGSKIFINEQNLLFHRIHSNAVCRSNNR